VEIAAAAAMQARRDKASNLDAWLRDMCEIDDDCCLVAAF